MAKKRSKKRTKRHHRASRSSVASYMSGARTRAKGRRRRAASRRKSHARRTHRRHDRMFDAMLDMGKSRGRKGRRGAKRRGSKTAKPRRAVKRFRLKSHAACVKKVIRANKAKGVRVTLGEASKLCKEMRAAGVKAASAAVKTTPTVGPQEQYAARCKGRFNAMLDNQIKRLEEKYCKAGWSRHEIQKTLETVKNQLAAA